jgi:hypothetical protein
MADPPPPPATMSAMPVTSRSAQIDPDPLKVYVAYRTPPYMASPVDGLPVVDTVTTPVADARDSPNAR